MHYSIVFMYCIYALFLKRKLSKGFIYFIRLYKMITLLKTHFKILLLLLFWFYYHFNPKIDETLQFNPNNINFKEK